MSRGSSSSPHQKTNWTPAQHAHVPIHRAHQAGLHARLYLHEVLGPGSSFAFPGTPESAAAYEVIWKFFDRHLR